MMSEKLYSFYIIGNTVNRRVGTRYVKDQKKLGYKPFYKLDEILQMQDLSDTAKKRAKTMRPGTKIRLSMEFLGAGRYLQRVDGLDSTDKELKEVEAIVKLTRELEALKEDLEKKEPTLVQQIQSTKKKLDKQKRHLKKIAPNGIGVT